MAVSRLHPGSHGWDLNFSCSSKNVSELYTSVMTGSGGEFGDACQNVLNDKKWNFFASGT